MKPKILIVDDQKAYLRSLERALRKYYDILTADSIETAKSVISGEVQVAVVDVRLRPEEAKDRGGLEFIKWLYAKFPDVVSIAMSAMDEQGLDEEALSVGAVKFLAKPVRVSELKAILKGAIFGLRNWMNIEIDRY